MTESRKEHHARKFLETQERIAYVPVFHDIFSERLQPLFPGYIFVHTTDGVWRYLLNVIGIFKVLVRGEKADLMKDSVMDQLRSRERNGVISLSTFNDGDAVSIVGNNAFAGWKGIYTGMTSQGRCRIMLSMLGQQVPVNMDLRFVKAAA